MDLRQLSHYVTVAETGSISAAAREAHVAQPALSRQMTALEEELGVNLFVRTNQGVLLTEAGEKFYRQSRYILTNLELMKTSVQDIGRGVVGQLRVGLLYSTQSLVKECVAAYRRTYPEVRLHLRFGIPQELLEALFKAELDVVFLRSPVLVPREFASCELATDELVLITNGALDPAPERHYVTIDQLHGVPFCLLEHSDHSSYNDYLLRACARNGFSPKVTAYGADASALMRLVRDSFGIAYLPASVLDAEPEISLGLYCKGIDGLQVFSPISMVWDDTPITPHCVRIFAENVYARAVKNRGEGEYYDIKHS